MQSLIKILVLIGELVTWVIRVKQQEKQREQVETIRNDPVDAFRNEFGGVPDNEAGQPEGLHGSKASAEVDAKQ
ncbi:hypothetical protein [Cellvibrio mixtus]|uniref:hypothetical protein n=1 Tax=Cellvibrio mixtus TaxID=39650 RepID=UPI000587152A|nr:hypothetical protein [Cellvibrio mixtus]